MKSVGNNIIYIYSKDKGKCLGYRFKDHLVSKLTTIELKPSITTKNIIKSRNERKGVVNKKYKSYKEYFLNNFKIDYKSAINHLNKWYDSHLERDPLGGVSPISSREYINKVNKYNHIFMSLSAINDGDLFFKVGKNDHRIHTNLTSLKKEYRKFIISDESLVNIDITNSQPYFLSLYLLLCSTNSTFTQAGIEKETHQFHKICESGKYYE